MVRKLVYILSGFVLIYGFTRVFLVDSFIAKGNSMFPAVAEGERIFVDKTLLGPRLYTDYDFTGPRLNSIRLPGRGRLRTGDWVITNYPYACSKDTISFKINYVYLKRCSGAPGETVSIVNGFYRNDAVPGIIGSAAMQQELRDTPDSVLTEQGVVLPALQVAKELGWTIKDFGPLYVPKAGDVVPVSVADFRKYRRLIQYETGIPVHAKLCLSGRGQRAEFRRQPLFRPGPGKLYRGDCLPERRARFPKTGGDAPLPRRLAEEESGCLPLPMDEIPLFLWLRNKPVLRCR